MSDRATSPPFEFFGGAQRFNIEHQYISVASPSSLTHNDIHKLLSPVPGASHTRNTMRSPPDSTCLPGTRTQLLTRVMTWVKSDIQGQPSSSNGAERGWRDDYGYYHLNPPIEKHVVWLCGPVGCGKSAIAQIVAKQAEEDGLLAASFFFFRGMGDRSRIARLADTLACQMAEAVPIMAHHIRDALSKPFALQGASIETQFGRLVYDPLRAGICTGAKRTFLIVLDGLDECEDRDEVAEFIDHMLGVFDENPDLPLRFFISSRIEEHIREHIETSQVHVLNLRDHDSDNDITTLVHHTFKVAASRNRVIRSYGKWPSNDEIKALIRHAKGSFIFIRTLLNFILGMESKRDEGRTPMERFKLALNMDPGLDGLYEDILKNSRHIPHFQNVVLTLSRLQEPLSISGLARLLDIPTFDIVNVLIPLQSVIHVPGDDETRVTLFHTSLRDFIKDESRSHLVFPAAVRLEHQKLLARRCLHLRFTGDGGSRRGTFPYAMHYWSSHWNDAFSRPDSLAYCADLLTDAGLGGSDTLSLRLTIVLCGALGRTISLTPGINDYDYHWFTGFLGPSHSRVAMDVARNIAQPLRSDSHLTGPDPSLLKCLIMHKMRSIVSCHPKGSVLTEFVKGYIIHDLRRVVQTDLDDADCRHDLWTFFRTPYRPDQICHPFEPPDLRPPPYALDLAHDRNPRNLAEKMNATWPGILTSTAKMAADISDYCILYKEDGLTVLDMLNVRLSSPIAI
ncbi:hypothetical protein FA13DRAFT_1794389 [Coprinellus micaceus]|uniref:NACHT domain-containing protein n=1 Tax=Coprinellus micaceus TaxID=71717 RepID=A0A4Y7T1R7_COPMI|nr:hypothetical protein FA13DRAFT_1794389 [Coprinellus micaceus]